VAATDLLTLTGVATAAGDASISPPPDELRRGTVSEPRKDKCVMCVGERWSIADKHRPRQSINQTSDARWLRNKRGAPDFERRLWIRGARFQNVGIEFRVLLPMLN